MEWKEIFQEYILPPLVTLLATAASALITWGMMKLRKWVKTMEEKANASEGERQAVEALMEGVEKAMEDLVIDLKKKAADGKLTKEERAQALDYAINHAKSVAKGPGLDALKTISRERAGFLVKQLLAKVSKK